MAVAQYLFAMLSAAFLLTAFQADDIITETTILYDGRLESSPDRQGFCLLSFGPTASQFYASGVTVLDTTGDRTDQAGYFNRDDRVLDLHLGYTLQFVVQLGEEEHLSPHRAGFNVIILSDDLLGLELAFWENEVWMQEGGTADSLFRHAEGVAFDTTADLVTYDLAVLDDAYSLSANGTTILSGPLRDYTAFDGFPDIYERPGLIFLGDNSRRGAAKTAVSYVALERNTLATTTPSATFTLEPGTTPTIEPPPTAAGTSTPQPTQTASPTAVHTATVQPTATATPWPADKLYLWMSCLKGVDMDGQK
jgi:hypothetical protein